MSAPRSYHNLVLAGFMGAGKTAVGRMVARMLRYTFMDTDELIARRAGRPVPEIFAESGEAAFRAMEREVVIELAHQRGAVIATGGGTTASEENLRNLKKHALVVCLWASPEAIWRRVKHSRHRPLLQAPDPQAKIRELLADRTRFYRQADVMISAEHRPALEVARQVMHAYQEVRRVRA